MLHKSVTLQISEAALAKSKSTTTKRPRMNTYVSDIIRVENLIIIII